MLVHSTNDLPFIKNRVSGVTAITGCLLTLFRKAHTCPTMKPTCTIGIVLASNNHHCTDKALPLPLIPQLLCPSPITSSKYVQCSTTSESTILFPYLSPSSTHYSNHPSQPSLTPAYSPPNQHKSTLPATTKCVDAQRTNGAAAANRPKCDPASLTPAPELCRFEPSMKYNVQSVSSRALIGITPL